MSVFKRGAASRDSIAARLTENGQQASRPGSKNDQGDDRLDTSPEGHTSPDGLTQQWRIGNPRR